MKKSAYEVLMTITNFEEFKVYAEEHWEEICAYEEEHRDEIFPEVPREQWETYCAVKDEVTERAREDIRERWGIENDKWPLGSCHFIWGRMQQIFKDEYGIDWKSPAECESDVHYD